jgi:hypothetical protein
MALELDTSTPIRSPSRQRELVRAIYDANPSEQETEWLEWKTQVDLTKKRWRAEIGRQVIGMANRDPNTAAQWADGCGFIVLGVAPHQLVGCPIYDNAQIEDWLTPFVGRSPNAPQWASTPIRIDNKDVLLITVEAPRQGDPIWPCRSSYMADVGAGEPKSASVYERVYVRHRAKTEEAKADDFQMLSARAAAAGVRRLAGISLDVGSGTAVCIDRRGETIDAWIEAERRQLLLPPEGTASSSGAGAFEGSAFEGVRQLTGAVAAFTMDRRSRTDYQKEVDEYLSKLAKNMPIFMMAAAQQRELGCVNLAVHNNTDDAISGLQIEVTLTSSSVWAVEDGELDELQFPSRPVKFGQASPFGLGTGFDPRLLSSLGGRVVIPGRSISVKHKADDGYVVTYPQTDLLPRSSVELDEIYLFADVEHAGGVIEATWEGRAKSLSHVLPGVIAIPVSDVVPTIEELRERVALTDD